MPVNIDKKYVFTLEQRIELIKKATEHIDGVSVSAAEGLLVDFVKESGAGLIVKGLRTMSDFEYEFQMASINRTLSKEIDTVFMMSDPEFSYLSSSLVREVIFHGGDIKGLVPGCIIEDIKTYIGGCEQMKVLELLDELKAEINESPKSVFSNKKTVDAEILLEILDDLVAAVPEEIEEAGRLLGEKKEDT